MERDRDISAAVAALNAGLSRSELARILPASAKDWAIRAIIGFAEDDDVAMCIGAGQAVEHLAKAKLLERAPDRLALPGRKTQQSAMFLTGLATQDIRNLGDVATVQIREAVRAAHELMSLGPPSEEDIEALRLGRNSALHLGYANRFMAINALSAMVRVVRSMLGGREAAAAWLEIGDEAERQIANIVLRKDPGSWVGAAPYPQHLTTEAHLLARGWAARRRWRDLSSRVPGDQLLAMVSAPGSTDASGLLRACPTGGHFAWYQDEYEEDPDSEYDQHLKFMRHFLHRMDCPLCGLILQGPDELEFFGVSEDYGVEVFDRLE